MNIGEAADTLNFYICKAIQWSGVVLNEDQWIELKEAVEVFNELDERLKKIESALAWVDRNANNR